MADLKYLIAGAVILWGFWRQWRLAVNLIRGSGRARLYSLGIPMLVSLSFLVGTIAIGSFSFADDDRLIAEKTHIQDYFVCRWENGPSSAPRFSDYGIRMSPIPGITSLNPYLVMPGTDVAQDCKMPFVPYLIGFSSWAFILVGFFLLKSLVAPAATGVILAYSVYKYTEDGVLDVLPLIEVVVNFAFRGAHPTVSAIYAVSFISISLVTSHLALRSGSAALDMST